MFAVHSFSTLCCHNALTRDVQLGGIALRPGLPILTAGPIAQLPQRGYSDGNVALLSKPKR